MYEHLYFMRKKKCKRIPSRVIPTSEILSHQIFTCPKWLFDRIGNPPTKPGKLVLFANEELGKTFEDGVGNIVDREG